MTNKKEQKYIAVLVPPAASLTHSQYISITEHIVEKLKCHDLLKEEVPPPYPKLEDLIKIIAEHKAYFQAGINGDRVYKYKRDVTRRESENMFSDMASFLTARAGGDPNKLQDTGYQIRYPGIRQPSVYNPLLTPSNATIKPGGETGMVVISCSRGPGVGSVEVMMCTDPSDEKNWQECIKSSNCSNLQVRGLQPGQKYYFRIRYIGPTGPGPWCEPISIFCV